MNTALADTNHLSTEGLINNPLTRPLFSIEEVDSHYLLAVDVPSIPAADTEIYSKRNVLIVEGESLEDQSMKQIFFQCRAQGKGIKAQYQNGVLWLLLPKEQFTSAKLDAKV